MPQDHNAPGQEPNAQDTPGDAQDTPQGAGEPQGDQTPAGGEGGDQEGAQGGSEDHGGGSTDNDDSGLWAGVDEDHPLRKTVADLRTESAARRTENRRLQEANDELKSQLASATSNEDYQKAISEYDEKIKTAQLETARERAGRKYGLPDELVSRLAGDTEEAMEEDAKQLQALIAPSTPPQAPKNPPRGGLNPNEKREDPAQAARAIRERSTRGITAM